MSTEWSALLQNYGITKAGSDPSDNSAFEQVNAKVPQLVDLSNLIILDVTGTDAVAFLQGQFCNDFLQVTDTQAQITGYCTPKGRLLALPTALATSEGYRLIVSRSVADNFFKRLSMFVLRSDVTIKRRNDLLCLGLISDDEQRLGQAEKLIEPLPVGTLSVINSEQKQLIRWHDDCSGPKARSRYIRLTSVSEQIELWEACTELAKSQAGIWQLADIAAGIPSITAGIVESFVPQMINLHLVDALSFTKGCYPGQEIVARMQYLGTLKRHMRLYEFKAAPRIPVPGDTLSSSEASDIGLVVNAAGDEQGDGLLLAVVKVSSDDHEKYIGELRLGDRALPYTLPSLSTDSELPAGDSD